MKGSKRRLAGVELNDLGLVDHLVDPVDAIALFADLGDRGLHLGSDFLSVGGTCAEHDVVALVHILDGFD